jgi:hypothetical protein
MKGLDLGSAPTVGEPGPGAAPPGPAPGDDFPACLAEAIEILADRARRHGLVEVVHLLDVAAMAARDVAAEPADDHGQT